MGEKVQDTSPDQVLVSQQSLQNAAANVTLDKRTDASKIPIIQPSQILNNQKRTVHQKDTLKLTQLESWRK